MKAKLILTGIYILSLLAFIGCPSKQIKTETAYSPKPYDLKAMYDENQPQPPVVTPPPAAEIPGMGSTPPSDAIVLFNNADLSSWESTKGETPKWKVENGYMEAIKDAGSIRTRQGFGSCQLHIEWAAPAEVKGKGQGRGNSGVFLMEKYEIQVLDSYNNTTYPAGMAAAVYAQSPPLVNAARPPGEWQSYDIVFHRPVFKNGKVIKPAAVTVFFNGILVQDNFEIMGPTDYKKVPKYKEHPDKLPISLQDHGNPVRYRNIWIRELSE